MDLSIIIVNWNTKDLLFQCLDSIYRYMPSCVFDVWVVDNASSDGSVEMVRSEFPSVKIIQNVKNMGFAVANNQAIRASQSEMVLLLNSDTRVLSSSLQCLFGFLKSRDDVGVVGPKLIYPNGSVQECYGSFPSIWSEIFNIHWLNSIFKPWGKVGRIFNHKLDRSQPFEVDRVSAACVMVKRVLIEQVGLLDERFVLFSEEYDWYLRIKKAGWLIVCNPQSTVIHYWGGSTRNSNQRSILQLFLSKRLYFAKHGGRFEHNILRYGLWCRFFVKIIVQLPRFVYARENFESSYSLLRDLMRSMADPDIQDQMQKLWSSK